jgi:apolipoprotein N-acyltransferase
MLALDASGKVVAAYDKAHLVPFGEYLPFAPLMARLGFSKLARGAAGFAAGEGRRSLSLPGLPPFSPLICYEVIFPAEVVGAGARPGWLLNLTNDAWYGRSAGPYQHFAMARVRAVEEGLPLVRVANTGISGVVDGYGRVLRRLGLGQAGIIDSKLPKALATAPPYARFGDIGIGMLLVVAVVFLSIIKMLRRSQTY